MQLKYGLWESVDLISAPECGLAQDTYDPYIPQDSAYLGAKLLAWLTCYYSYWGGVYGATLQNPGKGTLAWYYQQAGLQYPDTKNADGTANAHSLCAAVYHDATKPYYPFIAPTQEQTWSCPYSAKTGDSTLLDVVISTYNQGIGTTNDQGIANQWYIGYITKFIPYYGNTYGAG
jgi:hypothetical protein